MVLPSLRQDLRASPLVTRGFDRLDTAGGANSVCFVNNGVLPCVVYRIFYQKIQFVTMLLIKIIGLFFVCMAIAEDPAVCWSKNAGGDSGTVFPVI
jgi:hypothetical protein